MRVLVTRGGVGWARDGDCALMPPPPPTSRTIPTAMRRWARRAGARLARAGAALLLADRRPHWAWTASGLGLRPAIVHPDVPVLLLWPRALHRRDTRANHPATGLTTAARRRSSAHRRRSRRRPGPAALVAVRPAVVRTNASSGYAHGGEGADRGRRRPGHDGAWHILSAAMREFVLQGHVAMRVLRKPARVRPSLHPIVITCHMLYSCHHRGTPCAT